MLYKDIWNKEANSSDIIGPILFIMMLVRQTPSRRTDS